MMPAGAVEACVIIDDVELERAGDAGRWFKKAMGGGEGAAKELAELRCWCPAPLAYGDGGANADVGVGTGVFWLDEAAAESVGCFAAPTSPV
jgi:hypothetical protein